MGMGASGLDLMLQLQNVANRVTISRKKPGNETEDVPIEQQQNILPSKTILKDTVKRFTNDGVEFVDGSRQSFTTIIYATGERMRFSIVLVKHFRIKRLNFMFYLSFAHHKILFLSGYRYSYPFLNADSGIHIEDNFVQPLYKHIFNIEHPTMVFIGLTDQLGTFRVFDLEV